MSCVKNFESIIVPDRAKVHPGPAFGAPGVKTEHQDHKKSVRGTPSPRTAAQAFSTLSRLRRQASHEEDAQFKQAVLHGPLY